MGLVAELNTPCSRVLSTCSQHQHKRNPPSTASFSSASRLHKSSLHRLRHGNRRAIPNATESSQQAHSDSARELQQALQDAVRIEDYQKAAELRDALKSIQPQDTPAALKKKMEQLVSEEKFEVSLGACRECFVMCFFIITFEICPCISFRKLQL